MAELKKNQKTYLYVGIGAVVLYLLYRYYQNNAANNASTAGVPAPDTSGSDYAALAGQEQSDVATLQQALAALTTQEQSDVAGLQQQNTALGDLLNQVESQVQNLPPPVQNIVEKVTGKKTATDRTHRADRDRPRSHNTHRVNAPTRQNLGGESRSRRKHRRR